jgi:multiple sugar transport system substrate-binding protein
MRKFSVLSLVIVLLLSALPASVLAQGGEVTISWFMRWDQARLDTVAAPVIEAFEAEFPNVNVEIENIGSGSEYYTVLQTRIAGQTAPDVFYPATHIAYALGSKGAILPLNDLIARDGIDLAAYDPGILDLYTIDGQVMCLPIDTAALVVFYNKDMFDAAGLEYPQAGWTWADFLATAQALTVDVDGDGTIDQFGVDQFRNYWPMMVWSQTGHGLFDDIRHPTEFLGAEQAAIDAIQWVADLTLVEGVMPSDDQRADISDLFAAGKAGMNIIGHWRVPTYTANADFDFAFAPLPIGDFGEPVNRADGSCFAISAQTQHPDEAWELVKFLAGPGSMGVNLLLDLQQMTPALVEFQHSDRFLSPPGFENAGKEAFLAGAAEGNLFSMYDPIHPMYSEFDALWKQELGEVWIGAATAEEAMARMVPEVDYMLQHLSDYE